MNGSQIALTVKQMLPTLPKNAHSPKAPGKIQVAGEHTDSTPANDQETTDEKADDTLDSNADLVVGDD